MYKNFIIKSLYQLDLKTINTYDNCFFTLIKNSYINLDSIVMERNFLLHIW